MKELEINFVNRASLSDNVRLLTLYTSALIHARAMPSTLFAAVSGVNVLCHITQAVPSFLQSACPLVRVVKLDVHGNPCANLLELCQMCQK